MFQGMECLVDLRIPKKYKLFINVLNNFEIKSKRQYNKQIFLRGNYSFYFKTGFT